MTIKAVAAKIINPMIGLLRIAAPTHKYAIGFSYALVCWLLGLWIIGPRWGPQVRTQQMLGKTSHALNVSYSFGGYSNPARDSALRDADLRPKPGDEPAIGTQQIHAEEPSDHHAASIGAADTTKQDGLKTLLYMDIAEELKRARQRAGLSQGQLAALIGVQQSSISQWETGKAVPELHNRMKLASELKISVSELMPEVVYGPDVYSRDPQVRELIENFSQLSAPLRTAIQLTVLQLRDREHNRQT